MQVLYICKLKQVSMDHLEITPLKKYANIELS